MQRKLRQREAKGTMIAPILFLTVRWTVKFTTTCTTFIGRFSTSAASVNYCRFLYKVIHHRPELMDKNEIEKTNPIEIIELKRREHEIWPDSKIFDSLIWFLSSHCRGFKEFFRRLNSESHINHEVATVFHVFYSFSSHAISSKKNVMRNLWMQSNDHATYILWSYVTKTKDLFSGNLIKFLTEPYGRQNSPSLLSLNCSGKFFMHKVEKLSTLLANTKSTFLSWASNQIDW